MREDYRWHQARSGRNGRGRYRRRGRSVKGLFIASAVGSLLGLALADKVTLQTSPFWWNRDAVVGAVSSTAGDMVAAGASGGSFGLCHTGGGVNCVVDGDTFWMDGEKIRVADIDAPETHPGRCPEEQALGDRATTRLRDLLNAGPVTLMPADRDEDRYGRKLRIATRDGQSLGETLVAEGLARRWIGHREPWCVG